jgi:RimJ/RimL family protein N-acetyltransferase
MPHVLFATQRLAVRLAEVDDAAFIHALWTSPAVMRYVGFPRGLDISIDDVRRQIEETNDADFGSRLVVEDLRTRASVGQTKLGVPDEDGICEPDIKLHPNVWGRGYGTELWNALIDYAFEHSDARIVQGTPNRDNTASVRMQIGAGMRTVDEGVFDGHLKKVPGAIPVPYLKLQITRREWSARRPRLREHDSMEAA